MKYYICVLLAILTVVVPAQVKDSAKALPYSGTAPGQYTLIKGKNLPLYDPQDYEINYGVLAAVGGIALGTGVAIHLYQQNAWWKDERVAFHTIDDFEYALWIDKVGHFYATTLVAHLFSSGFEASNFSIEESAVYGSIAALAFELYVEVEDGYARQWGFSWGDVGADFLGAAWPVAQYYYPFLKNFMFKFSYRPVQAGKTLPGSEQKNIVIDDYEGQKYWLSMRLKNLLPGKVSDYWPAFLNIALGYGVKNIHDYDNAYRELYIALDLDTEELPLYGKGWQFVKNSLNFIHFPMPGIRITPDAAFFVFCF